MGHGNGGGDQLDRAFRKGLQQNGVGVKSDEYALSLAAPSTTR